MRVISGSEKSKAKYGRASADSMNHVERTNKSQKARTQTGFFPIALCLHPVDQRASDWEGFVPLALIPSAMSATPLPYTFLCSFLLAGRTMVIMSSLRRAGSYLQGWRVYDFMEAGPSFRMDGCPPVSPVQFYGGHQ